ncbi:helix-turn-helix domain-containing protein [Micromonospora sagamiensis]|uniref:Sugar-specific transcriptional regulator TrmB n=1 Tax=Micromonospora sagamiensis TaxID=47875 RepID=A0A562WEK2_9ACTN|nr:hypothetical protein [Micromonospora sagamiensis]TWJ28608.1 hypothetical protein JD81_02113 [Micromonospora sagamiensis]BCL12488.1 hypothetical protein GCM10017556_02270 [Micromonospora sagamiensis]
MLEGLGLPAGLADAYAHLVTVPSVAPDEMARASGTSTDDAVTMLAALEQHALASRSEFGGEVRWTAVPPLLTGQRLLVEQASRLLEAQRELLALSESHQRTVRAGGAEHLVEVVVGEAALHAQLSRLGEAAQEVLALVKPPFVAVSFSDDAALSTAPISRVIFDHAVFADDYHTIERLRQTVRPGDQLRVHPAVPMRLRVYDQRVGVLPLVRHDAQPAVLLVHSGGLVTLAVEFFEAMWREATPLPVGDAALGSGAERRWPGIDDRRVFGLLLTGATDATIAHQLGRSERWVQRRVRLMMDEAGARTRLQLGWEAHRRGWLVDEPTGGRSSAAEADEAASPLPPVA